MTATWQPTRFERWTGDRLYSASRMGPSEWCAGCVHVTSLDGDCARDDLGMHATAEEAMAACDRHEEAGS